MTEQTVFQLNQLFQFLDKIYNWRAVYLFEEAEKWGTELDWKKVLYKNPDSTLIQNFVKLLISLKILVPNNKIIKNGKVYLTYKLCKNYKKKIREEIIEITPEFIWLNQYYEIYTK